MGKSTIDLNEWWVQALGFGYNCTRMPGVYALGDLLQLTEWELWTQPGIGPAMFDEIKEELAIRGLKLRDGCKIPAKVVDARRRINEYARLKTRVKAEVRRKEGELHRVELMRTFRTEPARITQSGGRVLVARD